jgi:putative NIF3 family GTP cyclohydrolase 1 type 2
VKRDALVADLDAYFRLPEIANDAPWGEVYDAIGGPHWRDYAEPAWAERWNGLMIRGEAEVERAATCVFPSEAIVAGLPPRTFLFSEHPVAYDDDVTGFNPLTRESFERLRELGASFYHAHGPLDMHPEVSPSRLCAEGLGLRDLEEYFPIVEGIPGGAAVVGDSDLSVDDLAARLRAFLGDEIPVAVVRAGVRERAGRVAIAAGGGAQRPILEASLERGCETFVTGNAATRCRLDFVREELAAFRVLADEAGVAVVDGTHYGTEKPPQLAMVEWFRRRGLAAEFRPGRPERAA